ncbi:MAG: beta-N-acetylhexosaminidase [Planctomycetes bacterium]|nr:beta-N-acetylhexosaminidase [Planctomycetota bacterium]
MFKVLQKLLAVSVFIGVYLLAGCDTGLVISEPKSVESVGGGGSIIPEPKSIESAAGRGFTLKATTKIFYDSDAGRQPAEMLASYVRPATGFALPVKKAKKAGDNVIFLTMSGSDPGRECYELKVTGDRVVLKAGHPAGLFYAGQSVRHLLPVEIFARDRAAGIDWEIAPVRITDSPRFSWRAFMLDESRHFKGMDVVKSLLDQMAGLKMNVFHWHLVDDQGWRIEIKKYPKLTEIGSKRADTQIGGWKSEERSGVPHEGFYTQEQIKEIVQYAADRHITIVPEIEMPGHASAAIAAYPELGTKGEQIEVPVKFGKHFNCFNAADENVYRILSEILDEVVALFPGEVIHIGGDEVRFNVWRESDEIKGLMEREGLKTLADVQTYFTNRMSHIIERKGRRMMGWNEILGHDLHGFLKDGQTAEAATLSTNAIIHFWKGSSDLARQAAEKGHEVVNSWHSYTYLDYGYNKTSLEKAYGFDPIPEGLDARYHKAIKGLGCQMWGEWIPTVESMEKKVYPRLAAYAEVGWTAADGKDYEDFVERMKGQFRRWDIQGIEYGVVEAKPSKRSKSVKVAETFPDHKVAAQWTPAMIKKDWADVEFSVDGSIARGGEIDLAFVYASGAHGIDIASVTLYEDGKEISSDSHEGFSGAKRKNINYKLKIANYNPNAKYTIIAKIKGSGGTNSNGKVMIKFSE